jgi:ATP-dependent helicase HrpB
LRPGRNGRVLSRWRGFRRVIEVGLTSGARLPVDACLGDIAGALARARAVVVTAEPGAGKTTRVPPALVSAGPVVLLQPRRAAARAIARRIAAERDWTPGREIGWQVRFDSRFGPDTRLLVVTEGVLTERLQGDPLLSDFRTIVIDEFHERSVHADLAIALAKQAWRARDDLRIVVMSATLDARPVSAFLDDCPVIDVPGRLHPVTIGYAPGEPVADASAAALAATSGDVLCFLPGVAEIRRVAAELVQRMGSRDVDVVPLHGSLEAAEQDRALLPSTRRRIVVATNIAETSVTVPGVTAVVDAGLQKVARYDADRGIDSLEVERITADAAAQRAGRAGRESAGTVTRLWDARDRLRPHREPEVHRVDLSGPALDLIAWGADPRRFEWYDEPRRDGLEAALALLERLGAVRSGALTELGDRIRRMPLHPRLARLLLAAPSTEAIRACALLSERHFVAPGQTSTSSDLLSAVDRWDLVPPHVKAVARQIEEVLCRVAPIGPGPAGAAAADRDAVFRRAVLDAYPDRVAQRRAAGSPRVKLSTGAGAVLAPESGVRDGEFMAAVDVRQPAPRAGRPGPAEAIVRLASRVEREWLQPTGSDVVHQLDEGTVRARLVERYGEIVLSEHSVPVDPVEAARLLADAWLERGPGSDDQRVLRRLRFTGQEVDLKDAVRAAAAGARTLRDVTLRSALTRDRLAALDRDAPESIPLPSGRFARLEYADDGTVSASVKLQELFGLAETPRVGLRREPVLLVLLAPNGRPVQTTRDLRSFWDRTYPEVRRELRGRYPKHPWPEDPWTATPTMKTRRRQRRP